MLTFCYSVDNKKEKTGKKQFAFFIFCDVFPLTISLKAVICDLDEVDRVFVAGVTIRWPLSVAATLLEQTHCGKKKIDDVPRMLDKIGFGL